MDTLTAALADYYHNHPDTWVVHDIAGSVATFAASVRFYHWCAHVREWPTPYLKAQCMREIEAISDALNDPQDVTPQALAQTLRRIL